MNSYEMLHSWTLLADLLKHAFLNQGHLDFPSETLQSFKEFDHRSYRAHTSHGFIKDPFTDHLHRHDIGILYDYLEEFSFLFYMFPVDYAIQDHCTLSELSTILKI